jgi:hypothetical protein
MNTNEVRGGVIVGGIIGVVLMTWLLVQLI